MENKKIVKRVKPLELRYCVICGAEIPIAPTDSASMYKRRRTCPGGKADGKVVFSQCAKELVTRNNKQGLYLPPRKNLDAKRSSGQYASGVYKDVTPPRRTKVEILEHVAAKMDADQQAVQLRVVEMQRKREATPIESTYRHNPILSYLFV